MYIAAMQAPSGTVTLVFTDIQDSTPLWERHGPRFEDCLKLHNEIMRTQIAAHQGYEVKTEGDAFMIAFARATDAARFALTTQVALHSAPWPKEVGEILVRMGLHTGEPIATPDKSGHMDYFGPAVNRAARVAGAGHGGQILLSESAHGAAAEALTEAFVRDLGEHRLKGIERPERIYQALPRELDQRKFVALQTLSALPTNLPPQATSFVGREKELRDLAMLLRPKDARVQGGQSARTKLYSSGRFEATKTVLEPAWLVTITGPGGTGKTRLALRVGNELLESLEGGVWFVDLARARTSAEVAQMVATVLGVPPPKENAERSVANVLQYRKPLLLILDNFEQVAVHAQATIGLWRQAAPNVRFLATSRALLNLSGEREYELAPLPAPAKKGTRRFTRQVSNYDSVTLFVQRATEADAKFTLNEENADAIAEICAELDGLPLAIELAASRVKVLRPAQMVKKLGQKFELLKSARRDLTPRQQTMLGAIEWGFDLLNDWEKQAFIQACVFSNGFYLDAAEAVIDLGAFEGAPLALDAVQGLREKSLLTATETKYETRYGTYSAIRDFGRAKWKELLNAEQQRELFLRHARFYAGYVGEWGERLRGAGGLEALDRIEFEFENIFAAQDWALANNEGELAVSLLVPAAQTLRVRGMFVRAHERFSKLLGAAPPGSEAEAKALHACARAATDVGEWARGLQLATHAWDIVKDKPASLTKAMIARQRGESVRIRGENEESLAIFEEAGEIFKAVRDEHGYMSTLADRGVALRVMGKVDESDTFFAQAEELARKLGDPRALSAVLSNRGNVLMQRGAFDRAERLYLEAEEIARRYNDWMHLSSCVGNRGNVYAVLKQWEKALACAQEAYMLNRDTGNKLGLAIQSSNVAQELVHLGRASEALPYADEAIGHYRDLGDEKSTGQALAVRGQVLLDMGRFAEARDALTQALSMQRGRGYEGSRQQLRDRANLIAASYHAGDKEKNRQAAEQIVPQLENPPPKSDSTDEDMDKTLATIRKVLG